MKEIIVQIGCNMGNDHVFNYIKENQQNIEIVYLVDANSDNFLRLNENYSEMNVPFKINQYAIVVDEYTKEIDFYRGENPQCEHASLNYSHLVQHNHPLEKIYKLTVPAITLNLFFKQNNLKNIDKLFIDTEGMDVDIVDSIDFTDLSIKYIHFECQHSDGVHSNGGPKLNNCLDRLQKLNYNLIRASGEAILIKN